MRKPQATHTKGNAPERLMQLRNESLELFTNKMSNEGLKRVYPMARECCRLPT
jgi:hypothetical protein